MRICFGIVLQSVYIANQSMKIVLKTKSCYKKLTVQAKWSTKIGFLSVGAGVVGIKGVSDFKSHLDYSDHHARSKKINSSFPGPDQTD